MNQKLLLGVVATLFVGSIVLAYAPAPVYMPDGIPAKTNTIQQHELYVNDIASYNKAMALAKTYGKPILFHATASWCPACEYNETNIYKSFAAQNHLNKFTVITFDASDITDGNKALMAKLGIFGVPEAIVYNKDGQQLTTVVGAISLDRFIIQTNVK